MASISLGMEEFWQRFHSVRKLALLTGFNPQDTHELDPELPQLLAETETGGGSMARHETPHQPSP